MKVVINRGSGYFNFSCSSELLTELIKRGWKVTSWDDNYKPLDDTAYIFLNDANCLLSNSKHKDGLDAFEQKLRTDKDFIDIIENALIPQLTEEYPDLAVVEIPDDVSWYITHDDECGGYEEIHEEHRIW